MREGSGWTYQQIADHEGVEIGTIETLLWRARQALKRTPEGTLKAGNRIYTTADLLAILEATPERLSPNALLRPIFTCSAR